MNPQTPIQFLQLENTSTAMFAAFTLLSLAAFSIALPSSNPPPWKIRATSNTGLGVDLGVGVDLDLGVGAPGSLPIAKIPQVLPNLSQVGNADNLLSPTLQSVIGAGVAKSVKSLTDCYCSAETSDPAGKGAVCQKLLGIVKNMGTCVNPTDGIAQLQDFVKTACPSALPTALENDCKSLKASLDCTAKKVLGGTCA
ncbi:hypothetical protein BD779DRAFT_1674151 [Infundibulicybe gibba]|nr:hypothetical protein BD779DRAFT_1674151 [Infundibulicybe gibba]